MCVPVYYNPMSGDVSSELFYILFFSHLQNPKLLDFIILRALFGDPGMHFFLDLFETRISRHIAGEFQPSVSIHSFETDTFHISLFFYVQF